MKKIFCAYSGCGDRRAHFTLQDVARGQQQVEVEDNREGPAYCSMTCMILDGKLSVRNDLQETEDTKK